MARDLSMFGMGKDLNVNYVWQGVEAFKRLTGQSRHLNNYNNFGRGVEAVYTTLITVLVHGRLT